MTGTVTAAVLMIGDELLSGRTQDTNLKTIAEFLAPLGVQVREARVIPDDRAVIVDTVRALSLAHDYVFTTGGIGPTHDDITADSVAEAFQRSIDVRADALGLLKAHYASRNMEMTDGRTRMARIPEGAELIANPVSVAPGFRIGNVFVMAGVPSVMRGMLQDIGWRVEGGAVVHQRTVRGAGVREGDIAAPLGALAKAQPEVNFGSYPWMRAGANGGIDYGVNLVTRSRDAMLLASAVADVADIIRAQGVEPDIDPAEARA